MDSIGFTGFKVLQKYVIGVALLTLLIVTGCSTDVPNVSSAQNELVRDTGIRELVTRTVEAEASNQIASRADSGLQPLALGPNLYSNPGFENGLAGWTGCSAGAVAITSLASDVNQGSQALRVNPDNCFFRSAEAVSGQEYVLSCDIKIKSGTGWTGMGMLFEDSTFTTELLQAPTAVATSNSYTRYETRAVAPAGTANATMWLFSENDAVVDNCRLSVDSDQPPPPPNSDNLLDNAAFESVNGSNKPNNWSQGCGGSYASISGRSGRGMQVTGEACVDQGLSSGDVNALKGNSYSYSCYAKNSSGYASISIFLNGQPTSKVIPVSGSYQKIEITGNASSSLSSGFVSIYSEGNVTIDDCSLTTDGSPPPPPPPSDDNLLANGTFESVNGSNKPTAWSKGCGGSHDSVSGRSGRGMSLSGGACVDQSLSSSDVSALQGNTYSYSCYAKNTGGYASMSIFFNGQPISKVIPQSGNFQKVEITGTAPSGTNSGFASLYSEGGLTVDDCSLVVGDSPPPPSTCSGSASYTLTFTNSWTRQTHPEFGIPVDDPHFSDFKATNHNSNFVMWQTGALASTGVKDVAERGNNDAINSEINSAIAQGNAQGAYTGDFIDPVIAGQQRSISVNVSSNFSKISVVSMIAPSPDWFIGLNGLEMCQNGQWRNSVTRSAFGYDSGTDSGSNFESANQVSNPFVPIFRFSETPFGTFTLTRN